MHRHHPPLKLVVLVLLLGGALFLIGYFHRVAPATMTSELMGDFSIGATMLGNLSAVYFYSYVLMQVPTGVLVDRWGPRRILALGALTAGIGGLLFALAPSLSLAIAGRFLVGAAVAVAFISILKLATHWIPPQRFALVMGMTVLVGVIGGLGGGLPLAFLVDLHGWRAVMTAVAILTLVLALAIWGFVRDDPSDRGYRSHAAAGRRRSRPGVFASLRAAAGHYNVWLLSLAAAGACGALLTFAGLWGVPFLMTHYALPRTTAAAYCSIMLLAFALGGPLLGTLSERLGRRKPLYLIGTGIALLAWVGLILLPDLPLPVLALAMVAAGFGCGGAMVISFTHAKESVPIRFAGSVAGLVNMGAVLGPMLLQPVTGSILDHHWSGWTERGQQLYTLEAYQYAFLPMAIWVALALVLYACTRETYCRPLPDCEETAGDTPTAPERQYT